MLVRRPSRDGRSRFPYEVVLEMTNASAVDAKWFKLLGPAQALARDVARVTGLPVERGQRASPPVKL